MTVWRVCNRRKNAAYYNRSRLQCRGRGAILKRALWRSNSQVIQPEGGNLSSSKPDIPRALPLHTPAESAAKRSNDRSSLKEDFYPESRFGGYTDLDGTVVFHTRVNALVGANDVVVDIGCGRGQHREDPVELRRNLKILKGKCRRVIGIDVDPNARDNPFLDEFHLVAGQSTDFPLPDGTADLCVTDYVFEHVRDPAKFLSECHRILKPGGYLCIRTTNLLSYVGLAALLTPNRLHARVVAWAQRGRESRDVFPTEYRANTRRRLERALEGAGFDHCVYTHDPEPSYLSRARLAYYLGVLYQRHAPRSFGLVLFAFARRR
jgi:SAM-dependent methyltransferase